MSQAYWGACIILPTKHAKSIAIAPHFLEMLGATVLEYAIDTDTLGTFSGEVERKGNALECARQKCELGLHALGDNATLSLASEGSFGPHPLIPFAPCDQEILYFIDRNRGLHLHLSHVSGKTNYRTEAVNSLEALQQLANDVQFPSHALILRPNNRETKTPVFKGIDTPSMLENAFRECQKHAANGNVWVETDMRAQYNPSRMAVIGELAAKMADRLATHCPSCQSPGWGRTNIEKGLRCEYCDQETEMIAYEIYGCARCHYTEKHPRTDGVIAASQWDCGWCNP